jgi:hypothetical protein
MGIGIGLNRFNHNPKLPDCKVVVEALSKELLPGEVLSKEPCTYCLYNGLEDRIVVKTSKPGHNDRKRLGGD